jgi:hypothetical protein
MSQSGKSPTMFMQWSPAFHNTQTKLGATAHPCRQDGALSKLRQILATEAGTHIPRTTLA